MAVQRLTEASHFVSDVGIDNINLKRESQRTYMYVWPMDMNNGAEIACGSGRWSVEGWQMGETWDNYNSIVNKI